MRPPTQGAIDADVHVAPADIAAPMVLMLHGFPQFWWAWRQQLLDLADDIRAFIKTHDSELKAKEPR